MEKIEKREAKARLCMRLRFPQVLRHDSCGVYFTYFYFY